MVAFDQWVVAGQHHHVRTVVDDVLGDHRRVPGPERLALFHEHGLGRDVPRTDGFLHLFAPVMDHDDDPLGPGGFGGAEHVPERGPAANRVQDLGEL